MSRVPPGSEITGGQKQLRHVLAHQPAFDLVTDCVRDLEGLLIVGSRRLEVAPTYEKVTESAAHAMQTPRGGVATIPDGVG